MRRCRRHVGAYCKGFIDLIVHDLDPEQLRALAPEMPFELVAEVVFLGNADDVAERQSGTRPTA